MCLHHDTAAQLNLTLLGLLLLLCSTSASLAAELQPLAVQQQFVGAKPAAPSKTLKVMSLNLAHGRAKRLNQLLVSEQQHRANLLQIAQFVRGQQVEVLAVQEADASSRWSGSFNHVATLAEQAGFAWFAHALHSQGFFANYGTGVLSTLPISQAWQGDFSPSWPTTRKGYTLVEVAWPRGVDTDAIVDVVSLHLDFSRESVRKQQLEELAEVLSPRTNPLIVLGDFNQAELARELLSKLLPAHGLQTSEAARPTYKSKLLDWILISKQLRFVDYQTHATELSDHLPLSATLAWRD